MGMLDVLLRKVLQINGTPLTERATWNILSGATAADNPSTGATDITITGSAGVTGRYVQAMADANQVVGDSTKSIVKSTGALTVDRTLTFPAPATEAAAYSRMLHNACTGNNLVVSTGAGTTVTMGPGLVMLLMFTPDGVASAVTGV